MSMFFVERFRERIQGDAVSDQANIGQARRRVGHPARAGLALLVSIGVGGCATTAPQRYADFAEAGRSYVAVFDTVADHSVRVAVETDNSQLERARPALPESLRIAHLTEHNDLLRERLSIVAGLRKHARLLGDYFEQLAALARSDAPVVAGGAAAQLGDSLSALGGRLAGASVGEARIADFLKPVTGLIVSRAKSRALELELKARSPTISRELGLQEATLRAMEEQIRADLALRAQLGEVDEVYRPFAASAPLPASWPERRRYWLVAAIDAPTLDRAIRASQALQRSFHALVEGRLTRADLDVLRDDMKRLLAATSAVIGAR